VHVFNAVYVDGKLLLDNFSSVNFFPEVLSVYVFSVVLLLYL